MKPYKYDLCIYKGSTYTKSFQLRGTSGTPTDLTGATLRTACRKEYGSSITAPLAAEIIDAANGMWRIHMSAADTAVVGFVSGVYDVEVVFTDGTVMQILRGNVLFKQEATTDG